MGKAKILIFIGIIVIGISLGYSFMTKAGDGPNDLKKKVDVASRDYFEKNISVNETTSTYKITLDMLYSSGEGYDLSGLEDCDKNKTYSEVLVDFKNGKPKKVNIKLSC